MRHPVHYENRHLFFAVVLNTITPTIRSKERERHGFRRAFRYFRLQVSST